MDEETKQLLGRIAVAIEFCAIFLFFIMLSSCFHK